MSRFTFSPLPNSIEHYHTIDVSPADPNTGTSECTIDTVNNSTVTSRDITILAQSEGGLNTIGPGLHAVLEQHQSAQTDTCVVCSIPPGLYRWTLRSINDRADRDYNENATGLKFECLDHPSGHQILVQNGHLKVNDHIEIRASLAMGTDQQGTERNLLLLSYKDQDGADMLDKYFESQRCIRSSLFDGSLRMLYRDQNGDVKGADPRGVLEALEWAKDGALSACDYTHTEGTCSAGWTSDIDELKKGLSGDVDLWVLGPMTDRYPPGAQDYDHTQGICFTSGLMSDL